MKKRFLQVGLLSVALLTAACGNGAGTEEAADTTEQTAPETEEEVVDETQTEETAGDETTAEPAEEEAGTEEDSAEETAEEASGVTIKALYDNPHGDQSFASSFVVMDGDTISAVYLDEYQFMEGDDWEGVPNDGADFGTNYDEERTLISKRENNEGYSQMMADIADSQVSYEENMQAIEDFAVGKTVEELEEAVSELEGQGENDQISDVVSGATFVDTNGYIQTIINTANEGHEFTGVEEADLANAELTYSLQAPHGEYAFAAVAVLHDGDQVLAAALDEFQFLDESGDLTPVPNSDAAFGEAVNDGVVLASKVENDDTYSQMMEEGADATNTYVENIDYITEHAAGSTVEEIEGTIEELDNLGEDDNISDVVSGATFVDTSGYLQAIVNTIQ